LKSIQKLLITNFKLQIIVVDNGSTDDSIKTIEKFVENTNHYSLITNHSNLGFAEGNNVGIKYALQNEADYVLILNNDTVLYKDLLVQLIKVAERYKNGGAFSPKIYFAKGFEFHKDKYKKQELGKVIWSAGGIIDWDNVYGINRGVDEVDRGQYEKLKVVDFASGACVLYRASALNKVGLYDERYFMYLEDLELSTRMSRKGWKNYYVPKALLWHKVAQSSGIGSGLNDYFITRNRMLFGMRYAPVRAKIAIIREALGFLVKGRPWQRNGIIDYITGNFWKGSWR
jgi:GT2 family glycosyltransferase